MIAWLPALVGVLLGVPAGWGIRHLLASIRRGANVRAGVLETSSGLSTGLGAGLAWPDPTLMIVIWAGLMGLALGAVDIAHHRLPDALTLPAIPITVVILVITEVLAPESGSLVTALVIAGTVTALFWVLATLVPRAMGRGDVKLVPSLALMTGYLSAAAAVLWLAAAFVLGAAIAVVGLVLRRLDLTSAIPFGPCLLAGCWLVIAAPGLVEVVG